jgi:hypothetical protein
VSVEAAVQLIVAVAGFVSALTALVHSVVTRRRVLAHLGDHKPIYRSKPPIT